MKTVHRLCAALLAVLLLLGPVLPAAAAEGGDTISVRTAQDLMDLARQCGLDSWSQGKTVLLEGDIDLSGSGFTPIPTFGGVFDGQGHTISGFRLEGGGDARGLFRYVQAGGLVKNLTLIGQVAPSGRQDELGGLVGRNSGTLSNCAVRGTVTGESSVGGVAGVNEAGGQIVSCTFTGSVSGDHYVGGIAGQNLGSITLCTNSGSVNTQKSELSSDNQELDTKQLNSTENMPAATDIGGVAGFSSGVLQSCRNEGPVGYAHVGYNIGGIAGRQSGYLDGCVNTGKILGRKDVGGIVGQLEPQLLESFSKDFLTKLLDELDVLQGLMDRALNDGDAAANDVTAQMHALSDQARTVQSSAKTLTDSLTDWANGNIDQVNDLVSRVAWTLDQLSPIMDQAVDTLEDLQDAADQADRAMDHAYDAADLAGDALGQLRRGLDDVEASVDGLLDMGPRIRQAIQRVDENLGVPEDALAALLDLIRVLNGFRDALSDLKSGLGRVSDSMGTLEDADRKLMDAMDDLMDAGDTMDDVLAGLTDIAQDLADMVQELADKPEIQFAPIDETITGQGDALNDSLTQLMDGMDQLTDVMDGAADTLLGDMRAINQQFRVILALIRSEKAEWDSEDLKDHVEDRFQDLSDQSQGDQLTAGRLSASRNEGTVEGDINVAGVAGSLAVEYDFDPEDDLTQSGERSMNVRYLARAVVFSSVNTGAVTARKDYAGGVVGRMDLGLLTGCESYGPVTSTDGGYVGGVAGAARGALRNSWARCALSGGDYIGGLAGLAGGTLADSRALVTVESGDAYVGAVAGGLEEDDDSVVLSGNLFTSDTLGGVDGISYAGKAQPAAFDALCAGGAPAAFAQLELTFVADGKTVAVVPFQYGQGIDSLPEIPAKKGYSAAWPELDYEHLTAAQTLEAVYTPYASALSDGGDLPQILVDGSFSGQAEISHSMAPVSWTGENGQEYSGQACTVQVYDPMLKDVSYTVHYRVDDPGKRYAVWVQGEDGTWSRQSHTVDGHYLLLACQGDQITFCVLERPVNYILIAAAALAALLLLAAGFVLLRRRKKRRG